MLSSKLVLISKVGFREPKMLSSKVGLKNDWYQTAPLVLSCPSSKVGHENDWYQRCFLVKLVMRTIGTKDAF
nr:hypothetical protein Clen_163 [Cedratvirus lena]